MTIGDKLKCTDPAYQGFLYEAPTLTVSKIIPTEDGDYFVTLEEYGDFLFPISSFEVVETVPAAEPEPVLVAKTPREEVLELLQEWRDKWVDAENLGEEHDIERCKKWLDFYLDKLLTINEYDAKAATQEAVNAP